MTYLVDANVLSEPTKPAPEVRVVQWLRDNEPDLVIDPIILGEVRFGIELLPAGQRRQRLDKWFRLGVAVITCVPWEPATAMGWAKLLVALRKKGESISVKDSLIAATALVHDLTIATRNVRDFKKAGGKVFNPFG